MNERAGAPLRHSERHRARSSAACTLPEPRRGLLTQGSVLLLTSVADRTSPVQRGKWVLQVLLGSPPPPPPPDVPAFEDTKAIRRRPVPLRCASAWSSTARIRRACRVIA